MYHLNPFGPVRFYAVLFVSFIRLWRDLADENGMILRRKRNVILVKTIVEPSGSFSHRSSGIRGMERRFRKTPQSLNGFALSPKAVDQYSRMADPPILDTMGHTISCFENYVLISAIN